MSGQLWRVVGGVEAGGLVVREGRELASAQLPARLATGALIEELALRGERLHYRRRQGEGPETGWVSLHAKGSALLARAEDAPAPPPGVPPPKQPPGLPYAPLQPTRAVPTVRLPGGGCMPMSGLGLQHGRATAHGESARANVYEYLMLGGRHLDCGVDYENNRWVGEGLAAAIQAGVPREEVFLCVKVGQGWMGPVSAGFKFSALLKELGVQYIDLLMIHYPFEAGPEDPPQKEVHQDTWRLLDRLRAKGQVRDLGVSNFGIQQMQEILELNLAPIAANQLEYHPWVPERHREVVEWCHAHGVAVTAYCSAEPVLYMTSTARIGFPRVTNASAFSQLPGTPATDYGPEWIWQRIDPEVWSFEKPTPEHWGADWERFARIGESVNKSLVQVILNWTVRRNVCVIPGSKHHMAENLDIFDWALSEGDMAFLDSRPGGLTSWRTPFGPETLR